MAAKQSPMTLPLSILSFQLESIGQLSTQPQLYQYNHPPKRPISARPMYKYAGRTRFIQQ